EGGLLIDTSSMEDAAAARVRVFVRNQEDRIYGRETSGHFTIDNAGNGVPHLAIDDEFLRFDPTVTNDVIQLEVVAADPEAMSLATDILYSIDGGQTFGRITTLSLESSLQPQMITIDVEELPNSADAIIQLQISDGTHTVSRSTTSFVKQTPRIVNDYSEHIAGEGSGTVRLHFVQPDLLTNHRYRITFDDGAPNGKVYSVQDVDLTSTVLTDVPLSDGVLESPIFDGMSLVVEDLEVGAPNLEETGWISRQSDLSVSISGGSVLIAILRVELLETENDYEITITEMVSDTSVAMFAIPSEELYFSVAARPGNERKKVLFKDAGKDGQLNGGDMLYILEKDSEGDLAPAWELRFTEDSETVLPVAGDTFLFVPLRKLSSEDVFEFIAAQGVSVDPPREADDLSLWHYPNPFESAATIGFNVSASAHVTLRIYDVLGRHVTTIFDESVSAGRHAVTWDGTVGAGTPVASGVYLIHVTATALSNGVSNTIDRVAVRIRR
ncbi:MAG: T9SS type A sorting domain-containing protein, partial [Rhodothermia bacterium]|nr:T9SS type A sorting domain-containing protein [Rhodothermia bacterium]